VTIRLHLDRDSVAMGDDVESHETTVNLRDDTTLDRILASEYHLAFVGDGHASWVIKLGGDEGVPIGVWAEQWGHTRLVDPARSTIGDLASNGTLDLYFDYYAQLDPDAVYDQLAAGVTSRPQIQEAITNGETDARIAKERARSAETSVRLLSEPAIAALERVGASVRAHSDIALYLHAEDRDYEAHRVDHDGSMIYVNSPWPASRANYWLAWLSHPDDAARMLIGQIGERHRELAGLEPLAWPPQPIPAPDGDTSGRRLTAHWSHDGADRFGDFLFGRALPDPFASTALLPLDDLASAYAVGRSS
jgi:hypothetical protein